MNRPRQSFLWAIVGSMLCLFAYGMVNFPDSPIYPCGDSYCGKRGQPHSHEDYIAYTQWRTALIYGWPAGMLVLIVLKWR
jgi:hypothetical protein